MVASQSPKLLVEVRVLLSVQKFLRSSVGLEQTTVNRWVTGSNPVGGAKVDWGRVIPMTRECVSVGIIGVCRYTPK